MKNVALRMLKGILLVLLVLLIMAVLLVNLFGNKAIKMAVELGASKALKTDVSLNDVSLSILGGRIRLNSLVVANPPAGYQHPNLLELGQADIDVDLRSLMTETVNIDTMNFDDIKLYIEQKGLTNNLQEIIKSLPSSKKKAPESADAKAGKDLNIRKLAINNVEVKVKLLPLPGRADTVTFKLDPIEMNDIGTASKVNTAELTAKVLAALAAGIARQGTDLLPADMLKDIENTLTEQGREILRTGMEVIEKTTGLGEEIIKGGEDIGKGAAEALEGIFKKSEKEGK